MESPVESPLYVSANATEEQLFAVKPSPRQDYALMVGVDAEPPRVWNYAVRLSKAGEKLQPVYDKLGLLVRNALGDRGDFELPSRAWLVNSGIVREHHSEPVVRVRLAPETLRMMYNHHVGGDRVWWLARVWLGAALALGGLALLLRIGTGVPLPWRRPAAAT